MDPNANPYLHPTYQVQPAAPAAPVTPTTPVAPVVPEAPTDQPLSLDDLFPKETPTTPVAPVTPAAPVVPAAGEPSDAEKEAARLRDELNQQVTQTNQKVDQVQQVLDSKIVRQSELNGFFTKQENSPFLKFQNEITKVATDPRYLGWKLDRVLAFTLGTDRMMKIGGEMAVEAYKKAQAGGTGGTQNGQRVMNTQGPNYATMSDQEFANATAQVMSGQRPQ